MSARIIFAQPLRGWALVTCARLEMTQEKNASSAAAWLIVRRGICIAESEG